MKYLVLVVLSILILYGCANRTTPEKHDMSFFITSVGPGNGANLGGLEGAGCNYEK